LTFTEFSTESNYDFVTVFDGTSSSAPQIAKLSGVQIPAALEASSGSMFVVLESDFSVNGNGFQADFSAQVTSAEVSTPLVSPDDRISEVVLTEISPAPAVATSLPGQAEQSTELARVEGCSSSRQEISAIGGSIILSPDGAYAPNARCEWLISPSASAPVIVEFRAIATEDFFDTLTIYDGSSADADTRLGTYSGSTLPAAVTAPSGSVLLVFESDDSVQGAGFELDFSTATGSLVEQRLRNGVETTAKDGASPNWKVIAPSAVGAALVVALVLGLAFWYQRHSGQKQREEEATQKKREQILQQIPQIAQSSPEVVCSSESEESLPPTQTHSINLGGVEMQLDGVHRHTANDLDLGQETKMHVEMRFDDEVQHSSPTAAVSDSGVPSYVGVLG
jgi:hypothetical protein